MTAGDDELHTCGVVVSEGFDASLRAAEVHRAQPITVFVGWTPETRR